MIRCDHDIDQCRQEDDKKESIHHLFWSHIRHDLGQFGKQYPMSTWPTNKQFHLENVQGMILFRQKATSKIVRKE